MNDPIGLAINEYLNTGKEAEIIVNSNYTEDERIPVSWLFRSEKEMPRIEKTALKKCRGKILDVGAAAGCHSLVLQQKGFQVTALEKSELAAKTMKSRGVQNVICTDIFDFHESGFDTILLLMNGSGIGGTLEGLKKLLLHLKSLLSENGQILMDSSDIKYLFEEEDGSYWIDLASDRYYGEMEYEIFYKNETDKFNWLFIDFETLKSLTKQIDMQSIKLEEGSHFEYLAQITA
jgi:hypothetical protein